MPPTMTMRALCVWLAACALAVGASLFCVGASAEVAPAGAPVPSLAPMLAKTMPGVVSISVSGQATGDQNPLFSSPILRHFLDFPEALQPVQREFSAAGSGVVID